MVQIPWQSNREMCEVLDDKEKRKALIRLLTNEKLGKYRAASAFLSKCLTTEFRNYIHPYK